MSAMPNHDLPISETDYLDLDRESDLKHEFINGEVVAMAGASRWHNVIAANLARIIGNQILDHPCEAYLGDMRVHSLQLSGYTYPDVVVTCETPQFTGDNPDTLLNPTVIIEVLSSTTQNRDKGDKWLVYQNIQSLHAYVMVAQTRVFVDWYQRDAHRWLYETRDQLEANITLPSIHCTLSLSDVYHKVMFDT